jgi:hypothetical protein
MKNLNNYVAPQVEWVELFAENEVMVGSASAISGTNVSPVISESL